MKNGTKEEMEFIQNQNWINEFVPDGIKQIKKDLTHYLKEKKKSGVYDQIKELSYTDADVVLFYARILKVLEDKSPLDLCSVLLKGYNLDMDSIYSDINDFLTQDSNDYVCNNVYKEGNCMIITLEEYGEEADEDLNLDYDEWSDFTDRLEEKFGIPFHTPSGYWGK